MTYPLTTLRDGVHTSPLTGWTDDDDAERDVSRMVFRRHPLGSLTLTVRNGQIESAALHVDRIHHCPEAEPHRHWDHQHGSAIAVVDLMASIERTLGRFREKRTW